MTVGFYCEKKDGSIDESFPICFQSEYREIWKPACEELSLELARAIIDIPGIDGAKSEFKTQVINELTILCHFLLENKDKREEWKNTRIPTIVERLQKAIKIIEEYPVDEYEFGFN